MNHSPSTSLHPLTSSLTYVTLAPLWELPLRRYSTLCEVEVYARITALVGRGDEADVREDLTGLTCFVLNKSALAPTDCHTIIYLLWPTVLQCFAVVALGPSQLLKFGLPIYNFAGVPLPPPLFSPKSAALKLTPPPWVLKVNNKWVLTHKACGNFSDSDMKQHHIMLPYHLSQKLEQCQNQSILYYAWRIGSEKYTHYFYRKGHEVLDS